MSPELPFWDETGLPAIRQASPVSGGCINRALKVVTLNDRTFFVKTHPSPPPQFFTAEANGLCALRETGAIRCPKVVFTSHHALVLEYIPESKSNSACWSEFGRQLARLHQTHSDNFGFQEDNYCGMTLQRNTWQADGFTFFSENRLLPLATRAHTRGLLPAHLMHAIERLCSRLPNYIPAQPASLIHGDLWRGNVMFDPYGHPVLIDPAVHFGWPEADLAMTQLFGGFPEAFYRSYEGENPAVRGWEDRAPIYNLYHLLNHLLLFGQSYLGDIRSAVARYE